MRHLPNKIGTIAQIAPQMYNFRTKKKEQRVMSWTREMVNVRRSSGGHLLSSLDCLRPLYAAPPENTGSHVHHYSLRGVYEQWGIFLNLGSLCLILSCKDNISWVWPRSRHFIKASLWHYLIWVACVPRKREVGARNYVILDLCAFELQRGAEKHRCLPSLVSNKLAS